MTAALRGRAKVSAPDLDLEFLAPLAGNRDHFDTSQPCSDGFPDRFLTVTKCVGQGFAAGGDLRKQRARYQKRPVVVVLKL